MKKSNHLLKVLATLVLAVMLMAFSACGGDNESNFEDDEIDAWETKDVDSEKDSDEDETKGEDVTDSESETEKNSNITFPKDEF